MMFDTYAELDSALLKLKNIPMPENETVTSGPFAVFTAVKRKHVNFDSRDSKKLPNVSCVGNDSLIADGNAGEVQQPADETCFTQNDNASKGARTANWKEGRVVPLNIRPASKPDDVIFSPNNCAPPQYIPSDFNYLGRQLTPQGQYLLWHYRENVVNLMTVISTSNNPWLSIYLPCAYAAVADITIQGKTTHARSASLHAMTATAAFHIRLRYSEDSAGFMFYTNLGDKLCQIALNQLAKCLTGKNVGKYKDILVALLATNTMDSVKGSSAALEDSLIAAQKIISLRHKFRPRMSRKAMILHRICAMITLILRSTVFEAYSELSEAEDDDWISKTFSDVVFPSDSKQKHLEALQQMSSRQRPLSYMSDAAQLENYLGQYVYFDNNITSQDIPENYEAVSTMLVHGVPDSIVRLLQQVVRASRAAFHKRANTKHDLGPEISELCTPVEAALASWPGQFEHQNYTEILGPRVYEVISHHSRAMHESMVVYHYRLAKDVPRALLEPAIIRVLKHLEAIVEINREAKRTVAIPFLFPGFICACEIQPENVSLQQRYEKWFDSMREAGMSSYTGAIAVVSEVQRRRRAGLPNDTWWAVIKDWDTNLTLI